MEKLFYTERETFRNALKPEDKIDFKYFTPEAGKILKKELTAYNHLFFLIKGEMVVDCNQFQRETISGGECFLLPKASQVICEVTQVSEVVVMTFDVFPNVYDKQMLKLLQAMKEKVPYTFSSLPTCPLLNAFLDLLIAYLKKGLHNEDLCRIKEKELFIIFNGNYTREEIVSFFHPLIGISDFKNFIFENYLQVENVAELVTLSGMGRTAFDARFREEFGISARQWMLKQIANHIRFRAMDSDITIKGLMREFKFNSPTHFNWFCRQQYGCTPGELLRMTTDDLKEIKI